jgi:hypothetical protein
MALNTAPAAGHLLTFKGDVAKGCHRPVPAAGLVT